MKPDKPTGNGKRMNGRQTMDSHGNEARTRLRHHPLVPSQYMHNAPWAKDKRGYGLMVGRMREISYWDDILPKRGRDELESLGACRRS